MSSSQTPPRIGAVVVHYRRWPQVVETLEALMAQTRPPDRIVVVDNCSGDGTAGRLREAFPGLEVLETQNNEGYSAGMNTGIRHLWEEGLDAFALVTHECKLDPEALQILSDRLISEESLGAVGPLIAHLEDPQRVYSAGGFMASAWKPAHIKEPSDLGYWKQQSPRTVAWIDGACWMVKAEVIRKVGLLDERYFLYFEESSYCLTMRRAGWRTECVPQAVAWQEPASIPPYLWTRNFLGFIAQNGPKRYLGYHLGREAVRAMRSLLPSRTAELSRRRVEHRRGLIDFLLGRWGPPPSVDRRHGRPLKRVLLAHPSPDLYGSDRSMLQSLTALARAGVETMVVLPKKGPLLDVLDTRGDRYDIKPFPVLRKAALSPSGLVRLAAGSPPALLRALRKIREFDPDLVLVNTITSPIWLLASRIAGVPSVCHVREAEDHLPRPVAVALVAPLLLASRVIAISRATSAFLTNSIPRLAGRISVITNGIAMPEKSAPLPERNGPFNVLVVGRLSPRKGQDVALEALAVLVGQKRDVTLSLAGSVFAGYEWFEEQLRRRAKDLGLGGRVEFLGFQYPVWRLYEKADAVLVPSRVEPFGNVAVEAMAAGRPVIVSDAGGLVEIVEQGVSGLIVPPEDPAAIAAAVGRLIDDLPMAQEMAQRASRIARASFGSEGFQDNLLEGLTMALEPKKAARAFVGPLAKTREFPQQPLTTRSGKDRYISFALDVRERLKRFSLDYSTKRDRVDNANVRLLLALSLAEDANCIDVGANKGGFLSEMVRVAPKGRHIAYEPLPHLAQMLAESFPQVDVRNRALSDRRGRRTFVHVKTRSGYSGFLVRDYPSPQKIEPIVVDAEDLDSSVDDDYRPDLIKIDVEGAEAEVLRGAARLIEKFKPLIIFEHGPGASNFYGTKPEEIFEMLSGYGLRIFDLDGNGPYDRQQFVAEYWRGRRWQYVAHT